MREIRSRIAERKGVDLSNQQILDLAARRLEAVLAPQGLDPKLMEELRRSAGSNAARPPQPEPVEPFDETSLYQSSNGLVRALRALFRPLLSLLIDPRALATAFRTQAEHAAKQSAREAEQRRRQSEWNALHYEILRRVVTEAARAEIDTRDLLQRVESLAARVEFAERRVGAMEQAQHQARAARPADVPAATTDGGEQSPRPEAESGDGSRRRRRRRRGRRSGGGMQPEGATGELAADTGSAEEVGSELDDATDAAETAAGELGLEPTPPPPALASDAVDTESPAAPPSTAPEAPAVAQAWVPPSRPEPAPAEPGAPDGDTMPTAAAPPPPPPVSPETRPVSDEPDRALAPDPDPDPSSTDR